ncbi:MAG TPA: hypothetical protein EYQ31_13135 [Candidatus Handelsmanbacteria bacterium]|nr:hypothetical protein [Candidatus Handelsmanbacteria bacterium]
MSAASSALPRPSNSGSSAEYQRRLETALALLTERVAEHNRDLRHEQARVVLATMSNVYINRILESERFDTVIVEEAGMAILPTLFYCASLARQRTIMVGDPAAATHRTVQAGLRASRDADHRRSCPLPGKPCHRGRHGRFGNLCHPGGRFFPLQREHGSLVRRVGSAGRKRWHRLRRHHHTLRRAVPPDPASFPL